MWSSASSLLLSFAHCSDVTSLAARLVTSMLRLPWVDPSGRVDRINGYFQLRVWMFDRYPRSVLSSYGKLYAFKTPPVTFKCVFTGRGESRELWSSSGQPPALALQESGPPIMADGRPRQPPALALQESGPPIMAERAYLRDCRAAGPARGRRPPRASSGRRSRTARSA